MVQHRLVVQRCHYLGVRNCYLPVHLRSWGLSIAVQYQSALLAWCTLQTPSVLSTTASESFIVVFLSSSLWICLDLDILLLALRWRWQVVYHLTTPSSSCRLQSTAYVSPSYPSNTPRYHRFRLGIATSLGRSCTAPGIPSESVLDECSECFSWQCCTCQGSDWLSGEEASYSITQGKCRSLATKCPIGGLLGSMRQIAVVVPRSEGRKWWVEVRFEVVADCFDLQN